MTNAKPFHEQPAAIPADARQSYRFELPRDLLDEDGAVLSWLIDVAFDTLNARHLDLRIVAGPCEAEHQWPRA